MGVGCAQPTTMSLLYVFTPAGRIAESFGLQKTVRNPTHLVVPMIFGSVGAAFGVTTVFLSNAVILSTSGLLMRKADIPASREPRAASHEPREPRATRSGGWKLVAGSSQLATVSGI